MENPVDKDAHLLTSRFAAKKSTKFEDFKTEWLKCKFYYMHCVGRDTYSKVAIIESIFTTMMETLLDINTDHFERLGCLYLCYSLYCTQSKTDIKIRITLDQYEAMKTFHSQLRANEQLQEADFVLCRLKSLSAFLVCAYQRKKCMGHQTDPVAGELSSCGYQPSLDPSSDLMAKLHDCQKQLKDYEYSKQSVSDHLPLNLTTQSDVLDKLLDEDKLKVVKFGEELSAVNEDEEECVEDTRRSRVLTKQYRKVPRRLDKLK